MPDFLEALGHYAFLRQALLAGLAASFAAGVVGTFVVTRRITTVAGSLAHTILGGMGAAYYLNVARGVTAIHPLHGAVVAAVLAALVLGWARARGADREDTIISALWAVGMAIGVLFLFRTPGYKADLMSYLFGNIVMVDARALTVLVALDALVLIVAAAFSQPLLAICFDEEFSALRGLRTGLWHTLLLVLVALTVVSLVYVVGIVMAIALLSLPAATAGRFTTRLGTMMVVAVILSMVATTSGLVMSYRWDLPTGAVTILVAAGIYVAALALRGRRRLGRG
jgi:zinc transport system permease protein